MLPYYVSIKASVQEFCVLNTLRLYGCLQDGREDVGGEGSAGRGGKHPSIGDRE